MFSRHDLEPLLKHPARQDSPVLSLYLDVDLSRPANRNRGILVAARALLAAVREDVDSRPGSPDLDQDIRAAEAFLENLTPSGRTLALFCDASERFRWHRTLPVVLQPCARHQPEPYVRPLLEMLDEAERYAVVLTDRQRARLFSVALGEIEEHQRAFAAADVHVPRTTGTDHLWSEKRFQRRADAHVHHHLKQVAGFLRAWQREVGFDRLVVAGPVEATGELLRLLPRGLADRVVATWKMPTETRESEVLRLVMDLHERRETEREVGLTEQLLSASQGRKDAVVGLQPTLDALREGRVLKLLYTAESPIPGGRCRRCGMLLARLTPECAFCGGDIEPVADLLGRMARHVSDAGGSLDRLHGAAAEGLRREGGVGAFLRF